LGYVNKRKASESIVVAILQVLGGKIVVSERVTERMLSRVVASGQQPGIAPIASLSDRELEVFELLGQGLTMGQIAEHLHRSIKTIETYRERIKRKLSLDAPNELIRRATQWVVDGD
jgi:DNA-binding NarL/FixJ family response regulator